MTSLFLGVIDQPYTQGPVAPRRVVHRRNRRSGKEESFSAPASTTYTLMIQNQYGRVTRSVTI